MALRRLEKRIRALEEHDERVDNAAALRMATDEDVALMGAYAKRWLAAEAAGASEPQPTPEEVGAFERLEDLRLRALREGWSDSPWRAV
jgi:hypothetical protein